MKIMVLRNVFIGGKVFAEGKPADAPEDKGGKRK